METSMACGDLPRRPDGTVILRDYEKEEQEKLQRQRELAEAAAREIAQAEAAITAIAPLPDPRRGSDGRFRPGYSGNPVGRPLGSKRKQAAHFILDRLAEEAPDVTEALLQRAKQGDRVMLKVYMDRVLGPARSQPIETGLALVVDGLSLADAIGRTLEAVESGEITAAEGRLLIDMAKEKRKSEYYVYRDEEEESEEPTAEDPDKT
jgi:hypothetical protein